MAVVRNALNEETFAAGKAMMLEQAVASALGETAPEEAWRREQADPLSPLTSEPASL